MLIPTQQRGLSPEELPGVGFTYGLLGQQARRRRVTYRDISELELVGPVISTPYEEVTEVIAVTVTPSGVERVAVFPYFPVIDEFNDASAPRALSAYDSRWVLNTYDGINELVTTTDGGVSALNLINSSAYRSDIFGPDGEVYATIKAKPQDTAWFELMGRVQNPGNTFNAYILVGFANAGTDTIELWKSVGGSFSTIAVMQTAEYSVGDEFGFRYIGNQISVFKNGVQIGTTQTDNSITGDGYIGLRMTSNVGILDNFGGGRSAIIVTDAATIPVVVIPSSVETAQYVDVTTVAVTVDASASFTEALYVEALTIPVKVMVSSADIAQFVDSGTTGVIVIPSGVDAFQPVDTLLASIQVTPSATEIYGKEYVDAQTASVKVTLSSTDVAAYIDVQTIGVVVTSSVIEGKELTDSVTAGVIVTPSGVEIIEKLYADSGTIGAVVTPSFVEALPKISRKFGINDKIRLSAGQVAGIAGAITCASIVKLDSARINQWRNLIATSAPGGRFDGGFVFEATNSNNLMYDTNGGAIGPTEDTSPVNVPIVHDKWLLVVETKGVENGPPRGHVYDYSTGLWSRSDHDMARANPIPGATLLELGGDYFGTGTNWFVGNMAVAGVWNRRLTDTEIESLPNNLQSWFNLGPKGLWTLNQLSPSNSVVDLTGNGADQTSLVGTTTSLDGPVFDYTLDTHIFTDTAEVRVNINIGDPVIKYNVPTIIGSSTVKTSNIQTDSLALTIPDDCTGVVVLACGYSSYIHYLSTAAMTLDGVQLANYGNGGDVTSANTMVACWFYPSPPAGSHTLAWSFPGAAPTDGVVVQAIYLGGTGFVRDSYGWNGNGGYASQFPYAVPTKAYTIIAGDRILAIGEVYNNSTPVTYAWDSGSTKFEDYTVPYRNMTFTVATSPNAGMAYWAGDRNFKAITSLQITPPVRPTAEEVHIPVTVTPSGVDVYTGVTGYVDAATIPLVVTPNAVDVPVYTDAQTVYVDVNLNSVEVSAPVDAVTIGAVVTPSSTDQAQYVDARAVNVVVTPSSAEFAEYVDVLAAYVDVTFSGTDSIERIFTDAGTSNVVVTPSSVDVISYADTAQVNVAVTPSPLEVAGYIDAQTISSVVTPSGSELAGIQFFDSATVSSTVNFSAIEFVELVDSFAVPVVVSLSTLEEVIRVETITAKVNVVFTYVEVVEFVDSWTVYVDVSAIFEQPLRVVYELSGLMYCKWGGRLENRVYEGLDYRKWYGRMEPLVYEGSEYKRWKGSPQEVKSTSSSM